MSKLKKSGLALFFLFFVFTAFGEGIENEIKELAKTFNFKVQKLEKDTFFEERYLLIFEQEIDHDKPLAGKFEQRVYLAHKSTDNPVVVITEGYVASYASHSNYVNELSGYLNANQVCIEHRFFGESIPSPLDWSNLTIANAASDDHRIVKILKKLYHGKWISTGISKGGQACMYYRYFYPDDVDASVAYVCPLNFGIADKRINRFLLTVGDSTIRSRIINFQYQMLSNKSIYLPAFEELAKKRKLHFNIGLLQAYELTVLEYSFAFWQWGTVNPDSIPSSPLSAKKMVRHLDQVAGIDWISNEGIQRMLAFFYQALSEIGFYGYDISEFKDVISFSENPDFEFTRPEGISVTYDPEPMYKIDEFVRHHASKMIFIYGENDPWSATAVDITYENDVLKIIKPGGSHLTRISNLPVSQHNLVLETLNQWLGFQQPPAEVLK